MKVKILNCNTYETEDGKVYETSSRPTSPAPDGRFDSPKYGWHDVLNKWMKLEELNEPCEADI